MVYVSDDWDVGEYEYFNDDVKMICDMLDENWDTFTEHGVEKPVFAYTPEAYATDARRAFVYVYQISRYNSVSTTDYETLQRTSYISIRTTARNRRYFYVIVDNIYKILLAHRRIGQRDLHGYTWLEIINDRSLNDLTGWYTNTLDVKLVSYNYPMKSDGFGMRDGSCDDGAVEPECPIEDEII